MSTVTQLEMVHGGTNSGRRWAQNLAPITTQWLFLPRPGWAAQACFGEPRHMFGFWVHGCLPTQTQLSGHRGWASILQKALRNTSAKWGISNKNGNTQYYTRYFAKVCLKGLGKLTWLLGPNGLAHQEVSSLGPGWLGPEKVHGPQPCTAAVTLCMGSQIGGWPKPDPEVGNFRKTWQCPQGQNQGT